MIGQKSCGGVQFIEMWDTLNKGNSLLFRDVLTRGWRRNASAHKYNKTIFTSSSGTWFCPVLPSKAPGQLTYVHRLWDYNAFRVAIRQSFCPLR